MPCENSLKSLLLALLIGVSMVPVASADEAAPEATAVLTTAALTTGWVEVIIPVGVIDEDAGPTQYLMEDVLLPYGKTYTANKHVGWRYAGSVLSQIVQAVTVVRSQEIALGAPAAVDLFETGPCPTPAP